MARTLVQIRKQIEALEIEARKVQAAEVAGVVARIRTAIDFYGLTAKDLFGSKTKAAATTKVKPGKTAKAKKAPAPAKYKDPASDKTWNGHGKRPGWFVAAIASGVKAEDLTLSRPQG